MGMDQNIDVDQDQSECPMRSIRFAESLMSTPGSGPRPLKVGSEPAGARFFCSADSCARSDSSINSFKVRRVFAACALARASKFSSSRTVVLTPQSVQIEHQNVN